MKNLLFTIPAVFLTLSSCQNTAKVDQSNSSDTLQSKEVQAAALQEVPYTLAKNYFVKNTVGEDKNGIQKIETQTEFDKLFSPATTMAENGKPTTIDFEKQFVVAIISATTNLSPKIDSIGVAKRSDNLEVTYKEILGERASFKIRPVAILVIDKQYDGKLKTEIQKEI